MIFSRLLELPEFAMTGGAALAFPRESEAERMQRWAQSMPRERYRWIFKLYRRSGVRVTYADDGSRGRASKAVGE